MPMPPLARNTLPRHIVGTILYFSSYEIIQSFLSATNRNENNENGTLTLKKRNKSVTTVALSGAVAGALYQSVLLHSHKALTTTNKNAAAISATTSSLGLIPTVLRV